LETLITQGGSSKVPAETADHELVNLVAQYVKISYAQRQSLLELPNALSRSKALIEMIESGVIRPR
jgi:hypothetical protein